MNMKQLLFLIPVGLWVGLYWVMKQLNGCSGDAVLIGSCAYWTFTAIFLGGLSLILFVGAWNETFK